MLYDEKFEFLQIKTHCYIEIPDGWKIFRGEGGVNWSEISSIPKVFPIIRADQLAIQH